MNEDLSLSLSLSLPLSLSLSLSLPLSLQDAHWAHLACHGLLEEGALVLARDSTDDSSALDADGLLTSEEVQLNLNS